MVSAFLVHEDREHLYGYDNKFIEQEWVVKEGDVCIDVGFGPGTWVLHSLSMGARVMAFDPRPLCIELLKDALTLNEFDECQIVPCGLWDSDGYLSFNEPQGKFEVGHQGFPVVSLDSFLIQYPLGRLDFINFDVEAAEVRAIRGARETLKKYKPKVIVEVHTSMGITFEQVEEELRLCDYSKFRRTPEFLIADGIRQGGFDNPDL